MAPKAPAMLAGASALAGDSQPGDPKLDPCSLLTRAEVEQVVGKLKSNPTSSRVERLLMCEYELPNGKMASVRILEAKPYQG